MLLIYNPHSLPIRKFNHSSNLSLLITGQPHFGHFILNQLIAIRDLSLAFPTSNISQLIHPYGYQLIGTCCLPTGILGLKALYHCQKLVASMSYPTLYVRLLIIIVRNYIIQGFY